jgi:hypothetical protein
MQLNFVDDQLASVVDPRGLDAAHSKPNDSVRFSFDDRPWWLSYRTLNRVQAVSEYVPQNQTVQDWTELFTVQRLFGMTAKQITPRKLMQDIHGKLRQQHPDLVWQVLQDDDNDMIYEWRTAGDLAGKEKTPAQHEIARLLAGSQDIHLLAYAKKVPRLAPDERQVWVRLVREATLTEIATEGSDAGSVSHVEKLQ